VRWIATSRKFSRDLRQRLREGNFAVNETSSAQVRDSFLSLLRFGHRFMLHFSCANGESQRKGAKCLETCLGLHRGKSFNNVKLMPKHSRSQTHTQLRSQPFCSLGSFRGSVKPSGRKS
jgi:hypothetical protein